MAIKTISAKIGSKYSTKRKSGIKDSKRKSGIIDSITGNSENKDYYREE